MKSKIFTQIILFVTALTGGASAQLSGTYTIGGTTPDYATPQAAATAVQTSGVNGAVTFNIRPGTYNGKIDIANVAGVSATNTVTFKAENNDSTSVILTDTSSASTGNFIVHVFGTDYLIFRNLTFHRIGTNTNSSIFLIALNSHHMQIRNSILLSDNTTSTDAASSLINFPLAGPNDSMTISNNSFLNGSYGVYIKGQSTSLRVPQTQIINNSFTNQVIAGIQLWQAASPNIQGNTISTTAAIFTYSGILLQDVIHDYKILENKVTGVQTGYCIELQNSSGDSNDPAIIANNFLQTGGANTTYGISFNQCSAVNVYYNSININSTSNFSYAIYLFNANDSLLNFKNNILVNNGPGLTYYVSAGSLASITSSDYNNIYVGASNTNFAYIDPDFTQDFAGWKTLSSMDSHSVSGNPQFVSLTDLHVGDPVVNDNGVFIAGTTTDIDGQTRSVTTPDIGADEFTPLANNLGMIGFVSPENGQCGDSAVVIAIVIHNYGVSSQTNFPVHADITGMVVQNLTQNYSGTLATNANDTIVFSQLLNTYAGGTVDINAYLSLGTDQDRNNDTIHASFNFLDHPNPPLVVSPQAQCDNNVMMSATPDSGDVLAWFADSIGGDLLFAGQVFSPVVTGDTTFYVESRAGSGSGGCIRITEIEPDGVAGDFIEITNLSGVGFDATGWKVVTNLSNDVITPLSITWDLGYFNPGESQYKTDDSFDHYWGTNLDWSAGFGSYAMIIDDAGNIVDIVFWDWNETLNPIPTMIITVNGVDYAVGNKWTGPGYVSCPFSSTDDNQRIGNTDNDNASDWTCNSTSLGSQNVNLSSVLNNCGIGICGSPRVPVDVTLVPGLSVNIGNDTLVGQPFSITLDAGPGFDTYLWSTGHTIQSIIVSSYDTYWVTVTGGPNSCSFTDTIVISLNVGIDNQIASSEISLYPNPAGTRLAISGRSELLKSAHLTITDMNGRIVDVPGLNDPTGELNLDVSTLAEGIYYLHVISGSRTGVKRFAVIR